MGKPFAHPGPHSCRLDYTPLRMRRGALGVSREHLSRLVGVDSKTLWLAETGQRDLRAAVLVSCAMALGSPVHTLYTVRSL